MSRLGQTAAWSLVRCALSFFALSFSSGGLVCRPYGGRRRGFESGSRTSIRFAPSTSISWSPKSSSVIKHIPKSAGVACANHLAGLFRALSAQPHVCSNWLELFEWASVFLAVPARVGGRPNVSSLIMKRISAPSTPLMAADVQVTGFSEEALSSYSC